MGLPRCLSGKESTCHAGITGDTGSIPGSGRSSGGWHGNPLQYSYLENPLTEDLEGPQSIGFCKNSDTTKATYHTHTYHHELQARGRCRPSKGRKTIHRKRKIKRSLNRCFPSGVVGREKISQDGLVRLSCLTFCK